MKRGKNLHSFYAISLLLGYYKEQSLSTYFCVLRDNSFDYLQLKFFFVSSYDDPNR